LKNAHPDFQFVIVEVFFIVRSGLNDPFWSTDVVLGTDGFLAPIDQNTLPRGAMCARSHDFHGCNLKLDMVRDYRSLKFVRHTIVASVLLPVMALVLEAP
jgi:hypothetical protein